jgi:hypothetical protein
MSITHGIKPMKIEKSVLTFYIFCFFLFGFPGLIYPEKFSALLQYQFTNPIAKTEFMAAYGGLILGIGTYLLYCLKTHVRSGLVCVFIVVASLLLGRVTGYMTGGGLDQIQGMFMTIEVVSVLIVGTILLKKRAGEYKKQYNE